MSKPDYRLKIKTKSKGEKCNDAGAAWINEDESITLIIAPGIVLKRDENQLVTLFPLKGGDKIGRNNN